MRSVALRFVVFLVVIISLVSQPVVTSLAAAPPPPKAAAAAWAATLNGASADMIITAPGYPDLSPARNLATKEEKTRFVYDTLTHYADQSQAGLRKDLELHHIAHQVLWISNGIWVPAMDRATLLRLSTRTDVAHIDLDVKSPGIQTQALARLSPAVALSIADQPIVAAPQTVEWGVSKVNAPQVWAMGYTGQGIVLADLDTGVMWAHPALQPKYRGWNGITATHDYNWYDPTGKSASIPTDDNGHGTHTTGSLVGDDGTGNQVGVAPGAQWIACRNMDAGQGSVALYTACFQFALAPGDANGSNANPSRAADITSNSWTCWGGSPWNEVGCYEPAALLTVTQALRTAGIMVVAAAGNEGPGCSTVGHAPGTYDGAFSIGAIDSTNAIAGFSSRGPSTYSGHMKPNIVAPGVDVNSSLNGGGYGPKSGTSMATPHVAGVAALLWSAAPWLRGNVDETEAVLTSTAHALTNATTCGGVPGSSVPNNTFGYGLINAQAAVNEARAIVPQAYSHFLYNSNLDVSFDYVVENTSLQTRSNVILTATIPASSGVVSVTSGGMRVGAIVSWTLGSLLPDQIITRSLVVLPLQVGDMVSHVGAVYDGIVSRRVVPGADTIITVISPPKRLLLLLVMRS